MAFGVCLSVCVAFSYKYWVHAGILSTLFFSLLMTNRSLVYFSPFLYFHPPRQGERLKRFDGRRDGILSLAFFFSNFNDVD